MRNFLLSFLIFLIWAFLGIWWYYSCSWCASQSNNLIIQEKTHPTSTTITNKKTTIEIDSLKNNSLNLNKSITDSLTLFNLKESFKIFKNSDSIIILNQSIKDSIFNYLNKHQNQELQIIAWYNKDETNTSPNNLNLGIKRANHLKEILSDFGINPDKIYTKGEISNYNYSQKNDFIGGVNLLFKEISIDHLSKIDHGITHKTLYSYFNRREFKPDNTLQAYAFELKNHLSNNPQKKVMITGHSDNVGDEETNEIVARDRATNVLKYLVSQGIDKTKLTASSKGELEPIATNSTKEGRAQNRRIEITVN